MENKFPIFFVFSVPVFFSVSAIVGYNYEGSQDSNVYVIYNIVLFVIATLFIFFKFFLQKRMYSYEELLIMTTPLIVTFFLFISFFNITTNNIALLRYSYFVLWVFPSIYIGIYLREHELIDVISNFLLFLMLLISLSGILTTIEGLMNNSIISIGGASYQYASYLSAFSFGLNLYFLFYGYNHKNLLLLRNKYVTPLLIILLFTQFISTISSGGRGAMILLIVYAILIPIMNLKKIKFVLKYFIVITILVSVVLLLSSFLSQFELFEFSLNRAFSYISIEGIDLGNSSGRDLIYARAIDLIAKKPIFGYGIFNMYNVFGGYPHNLILEILLQGGVLYLLFWIILMIITTIKLVNIIKRDPKNKLILILFIYPLVMFMFSGTYLNDTIFWFCMSYMFSK